MLLKSLLVTRTNYILIKIRLVLIKLDKKEKEKPFFFFYILQLLSQFCLLTFTKRDIILE